MHRVMVVRLLIEPTDIQAISAMTKQTHTISAIYFAPRYNIFTNQY